MAVMYWGGDSRLGFLRLTAPRWLAAFALLGRRRRSWGWFRGRGRGDDRLRRRGLVVGTRREDPCGNHDGNHRRVTPQLVAGHYISNFEHLFLHG